MGQERNADSLDPTVSLGFILNLPLSRVEEIRRFLLGLAGVRVVVSKLGPPRTLWIREGPEPQREGRP